MGYYWSVAGWRCPCGSLWPYSFSELWHQTAMMSHVPFRETEGKDIMSTWHYNALYLVVTHQKAAVGGASPKSCNVTTICHMCIVWPWVETSWVSSGDSSYLKYWGIGRFYYTWLWSQYRTQQKVHTWGPFAELTYTCTSLSHTFSRDSSLVAQLSIQASCLETEAIVYKGNWARLSGETHYPPTACGSWICTTVFLEQWFEE